MFDRPNNLKHGVLTFPFAKWEKESGGDILSKFFSYFKVLDQNSLKNFDTEDEFCECANVVSNQEFLSQKMLFRRKSAKILYSGVYYDNPECYFYVFDFLSPWTCEKSRNSTTEISMRNDGSRLFIRTLLDEKDLKNQKIVHGCCIPTIYNNPLMFFTPKRKNLDGKNLNDGVDCQVYQTSIIVTKVGVVEKNRTPRVEKMVSSASPACYLNYFYPGPCFFDVCGLLSVNLKMDFPDAEISPTIDFITRVGVGKKNGPLPTKKMIDFDFPNYFVNYFYTGRHCTPVSGFTSVKLENFIPMLELFSSSLFSSVWVPQDLNGPPDVYTTLIDPYSDPIYDIGPLVPHLSNFSLYGEGERGGGVGSRRLFLKLFRLWEFEKQKRRKSRVY